ncbi:Ribonucleases P/MRP protein subunit POP1 [Carpediemonas membranifera]|uniref:Ribonucleases P/MRP protein subunit POP1 n=1 Tax=Carpediemonas membranifera TaxID=201153 RepID=A0A8J6B5V6_9EUKA|nr:Ribonucleases P/MRP protein subunit POP1 [Carpediemonas membranifera]|eukprot:KAG9393704.1 Ribonucleases P/MRP protein subunit POP1 [Carpediemonas membranifera]
MKHKGTSRIFQRLPRHLRRRAMSYDVHRYPRNVRQAVKHEMDKTSVDRTTGEPIGPKKLRKAIRKRSNFLTRTFRLSRPNVWLETHLWNVKRFHMAPHFGYTIPTSATMKGLRTVWRIANSGAVVHDMSYYTPIEVPDVAALPIRGTPPQVDFGALLPDMRLPLTLPIAIAGDRAFIIVHSTLADAVVAAVPGAVSRRDALCGYRLVGPASLDVARTALVPVNNTAPTMAPGSRPDPTRSSYVTVEDPRIRVVRSFNGADPYGLLPMNKRRDPPHPQETAVGPGQAKEMIAQLNPAVGETPAPAPPAWPWPADDGDVNVDQDSLGDLGRPVPTWQLNESRADQITGPPAPGPRPTVCITPCPMGDLPGLLVLAPANWGGFVYRGLVHARAHPLGREEWRYLTHETGRALYPEDCPLTAPGYGCMVARAWDALETWRRRPPAKRAPVDAGTLPAPFMPPISAALGDQYAECERALVAAASSVDGTTRAKAGEKRHAANIRKTWLLTKRPDMAAPQTEGQGASTSVPVAPIPTDPPRLSGQRVVLFECESGRPRSAKQMKDVRGTPL